GSCARSAMFAGHTDVDERVFEQTACGRIRSDPLPRGGRRTTRKPARVTRRVVAGSGSGSGERAQIPLAGRGHARQEVVQGLALVLAERCEQLLAPELHGLTRAREPGAAGAGQVDGVAAAVGGVA